jgi:KUP system potassium uptake protein
MNERKNQFFLSLGALGIVFGDIGTSPLYAMSEIFFHHGGRLKTDPMAVLGVCSLIVWALILIISIKYLLLVMRASNDGEGGVFALYGLLYRFRREKRSVAMLLTLLILAAGFLFGDGMITPAISVLSAVEGLKFTYPSLEHLVVPLSVIILTLLFLIQKNGTQKVGIIFGPVLLVWFFAIGYFGLLQIVEHPEILKALNPSYAAEYLSECSATTFLIVFGGVILAITGGEALYADMGHFDVKSIRRSWFLVVFPALILNYLGQGAYLLSGKGVLYSNIFFSSISEPFKFPMVLLATVSTVIASQALISGVFSLATQAVALGLFPKLKIHYTHDKHSGQVYVPLVNWVLLFGCLSLVLGFKASQNLASAYGLAVSADMFLTSVAMMSLSCLCWKWSVRKSIIIFGLFALIDMGFLMANSSKIIEGGYIPLLVGLALFLIMTTWRWGRKATYKAYSSVQTKKISEIIELHREHKIFAQKNLLLLVPKPIMSVEQNAPALMKMVHERYGLLANNIFFVEIVHKKIPYLHDDRYEVKVFERNENGMIASVIIKFGFMEDPNVEQVLEGLARHHEILLSPEPKNWVFHVSLELLKIKKNASYWHRFKVALFSLLRQTSRPGFVYYGLGDEVQLSIQIIPVKI